MDIKKEFAIKIIPILLEIRPMSSKEITYFVNKISSAVRETLRECK